MVSGSRIEGGPQVLSAGVRRTIQSIKEIVGNHSDADIYVALKETNMDPNETTQKLLTQDPFHEVKRKRDRKKENPEHKRFVAAGPRKNTELALIPAKNITHSDHNTRRSGPGRNVASGVTHEFRVVRDNRVNQSATVDSKPTQSSTSRNEGVISSGPIKSNSTESSGHRKPLVGQNSSQALNSHGDSQRRQTKDSTSRGNDQKEMPGERRLPTPSAALRVQTKANSSILNPTNSSSNFVAGVYSSSSDPVHVPSHHSRPAANIGAIRRDVGVVGPRRQPSENSTKLSPSQRTPVTNTHSRQDGHSQVLGKPLNAISESEQSRQNMGTEPGVPDMPVGRSVSNNQHASRTYPFTGHQKVPQPNKEWKPKSSLKSSSNASGVIGGSPKIAPLRPENPEDLKKEVAQVQDSMSQLNISEGQNVIIAPHIRVSETDRSRLTFGSLGTNLDASVDSICMATEGADLSIEPTASVSVSVSESSGDEPDGGNQIDMLDDRVQRPGADSPSSSAILDHKPVEKNESLIQQNPDNYTDVVLVRDNSPSYPLESLQHQSNSELPSLSGYDPQVGYEVSYFHPSIDETVREPPGLPSHQEVLNTHATSIIPASTAAMAQQQQQLAQMYPQLHVSHFTNLMPYRQLLYAPPMPVPGYSNNPAYPHPSNGSSYVLMPGNSSHLTPSGIKYGIQQFKTVPAGSQTGFGNFTTPTGYAVNTPGVVGGSVGHDDSSRIKYKDNLYVPNPQAETSEIWMSPRELPGLQSASYYNMPGPIPHPAYLTSHGSHASFNAAAAAAQSSHMQFPGMYHPSPQPGAIASPHHLGPAIGGNVGVGVAAPAPGAQVGAYQQPQLGHFNWTGNF